jgi:regulator of protease activity HflC (stomatin/prohibitin superfamily)
MAIPVRCATCGKALSATPNLAGKTAQCPACGTNIQVPSRTSHPPVATIRAPDTIEPVILPSPLINRSGITRQSITISQILQWLFISWGIVVFLAFGIGLVVVNALITIMLVVILSSVFFAAMSNLFMAKKKALKCGTANAWFGLLQVAAWDPTEGVLFLKDKKLDYVDSNPNDGGGIRVVLPFHGEEEVCRVPLEVQTSEYSDEKVLTREYVPLKMTGTIYWRIIDVARFYLLVSREIHKLDDRGGHKVVQPETETKERGRLRSGNAHQLEAAEEWLRLIAEEQTRSVVARVRTGLLVADQVAAALPLGLREQLTPVANREQEASVDSIVASSPSSSKSYRSAADALGDAIRGAMESIVPEYGIHVDRVSLQEARLPEEILKKAAEVCTTAYVPLEAQRQATADMMDYAALAEKRRMYLAGEVEVIGKDAVSKREVVGSIQPFALGGRGGGGGLLDLLTYYFEGAQRDSLPQTKMVNPDTPSAEKVLLKPIDPQTLDK